MQLVFEWRLKPSTPICLTTIYEATVKMREDSLCTGPANSASLHLGIMFVFSISSVEVNQTYLAFYGEQPFTVRLPEA